MGQFLDDQLNKDKYYYCSANLRYPKENILGLILQFFVSRNSRELHIDDIENYVKGQLGVERINSSEFARFLNSNNFVNIDYVSSLYEKYSGKKVDTSKIAPKETNKIQKPIKTRNQNIEYYYCSKMVRFPLKDVVVAIYNYYKDNNLNSAMINELYTYLGDKFNVKSFNRGNLCELLKSSAIVPFSSVKDLYIKLAQVNETNSLYDLDMIEYIFVKNRKALRNVINTLGLDSIKEIVKNGLLRTITCTNALNEYFGNEDSILELIDPSKDKILKPEDTKVFLELLDSFNEEEWLAVLENEADIKEHIQMFIEDKQIEAEKISFRNVFLSYLSYVNADNLSARLQYLFPYNVYQILQKHNIHIVSDLNKLTKEATVELYQYRDIVLNSIKKLQISLPSYLNERFKYLIQMVNKDYIPNSLWQKYVIVLENRADGKTLKQSGASLGVTRERVRQLDRKYTALFNEFYNANGNLNNLIRAYVNNPLFITNEDMQKIFSFNPKIFKYLLSNIEVENLLYIEEIDKFYFVDDYDWYKELVMFGENMPAQLSASNLQSYINNALEMLNKNSIQISQEDCKLILIQDYKLLGTVYSKSNLSLGQKIKSILIQYFPKPVSIYDPSFLTSFRDIYKKLYDDDKIKTDHAIQSIIARVGMLVGRGMYVANDRIFMSESLANEIYDYIINSGRTIFLTNNLFCIFEDKLQAEGIENKYFMQGALKQRFDNKLFFRRDYISTTEDVTNIYGEIYKFIKDANRLVTIDELQEEFKGTHWNVLMMMAVSQEGILNYRTKYISVDALTITDEDKEYLHTVAQSLISDGGIHHINDLLAYIRITNRKLLEKLFIEDQFALYSVIEYLFGSEFELKRPFIAQKGIKIENQYDRIKEFVESQEELTIDDLLDFVTDNKLRMHSISEFIDGLENYVFKNENEIISLSKTNVNKYNVEVAEKLVLKELGSNDFIFADKIQMFNLYPREVEWTPWLLYSALNKYGKSLKAIPSDTKFKLKNIIYARPLIIRKEVPAKNINEYIEYLKNKTQLDDTEFYKYLRVKGLA